MKRAIFIDKDGTLIHNVHYNVDPKLIRFTKGAVEGLKKFVEANFEIFIISNQQGIALGYFSKKDLTVVKQTIKNLLTPHNIQLSGFYYCPHLAAMQCFCRKPKPGMIIEAAKVHQIDLHNSWVIGDVPADIQAGVSAGCKTVLFDKGYENNWKFNNKFFPNYTVKSLTAAAELIVHDKYSFVKRPYFLHYE